MHKTALLNDDPHTCQGPACDNLTLAGKPLCADCEAFYQGVRDGS